MRFADGKDTKPLSAPNILLDTPLSLAWCVCVCVCVCLFFLFFVGLLRPAREIGLDSNHSFQPSFFSKTGSVSPTGFGRFFFKKEGCLEMGQVPRFRDLSLCSPTAPRDVIHVGRSSEPEVPTGGPRAMLF